MRIALATCAALPELDEDGPALLAALPEAEPVVWDSGADWDAFDLVVVRSTWDYVERLAEFQNWARSVPRLANPAAVLTWNLDKTYLRELSVAGVPVVPTTWLRPGEEFVDPVGAFVVKPTVSAGARDTARYDGPDSAAHDHVQALLAAGRDVMIQPYLDAVDSHGETSVVLFEGRMSHGIRKGPLLAASAGVRQDIDSRAAVGPREPSPAEVAVARAAVAAVGQDLLYARVDLVPGPDGSPLVLELELSEPSLFLRHSPGAAERFAAAVRARADRSSRGGSAPRS